MGRAQPSDADALTAAGLGLSHGEVELRRSTQAWVTAGRDLCARTESMLAGLVDGVEFIGSASVVGLLAKPIVDLAVGLGPAHVLEPMSFRLTAAGWIYRGDAGQDGGHVFVLESRPRRRVAHLHAVP